MTGGKTRKELTLVQGVRKLFPGLAGRDSKRSELEIEIEAVGGSDRLRRGSCTMPRCGSSSPWSPINRGRDLEGEMEQPAVDLGPRPGRKQRAVFDDIGMVG